MGQCMPGGGEQRGAVCGAALSHDRGELCQCACGGVHVDAGELRGAHRGGVQVLTKCGDIRLFRSEFEMVRYLRYRRRVRKEAVIMDFDGLTTAQVA